MEDNELSSSANSSNRLQDIVGFLEGIEQSVKVLKTKIDTLSAKYPITAQEKRLNQIIEKIRRDVQERIAMEKLLRETTLSLEETPTPSSSSEGTVESFPTPPQEVDYPVDLYNSSCLRRRTIDQVGKLGQTLPRKKKVKVVGMSVETLTNDKYDPEKRAIEWMKELKSLSQNGPDYTKELEQIDSEDVIPNAQAIVLDVGKTNLKKGNIPFFFFESQTGDLIISREKFFLSSKEYAQLRGYDPNQRLEMAMKVGAANYEYWSSVYYKGLRNKEKDPMQQSLVKEYLRHYIKDPLNSRGLIYYYQVNKTSYNQQLQCQSYIGKCEGSLVEKLREIHEEQDQEKPSLLKLALQSKLLYSEESEVGDILKKNVVLILDFGYTEEFLDKYKGRLDKGDRLAVLQKNYVEYFGGRSPIGLN